MPSVNFRPLNIRIHQPKKLTKKGRKLRDEIVREAAEALARFATKLR